MLSITKLRVGQEAYQLSGVAQSLDDYYTGAGESAGEWLRLRSAPLGLANAVTAEDLHAVLAGLAPGTGLSPNGDQLRTWKGRVPGFDLTFSAPKSVSVLYALGDPIVRADVVDAHQAGTRDYSSPLWTLLMFEAFLRNVAEAPASPPRPRVRIGRPDPVRVERVLRELARQIDGLELPAIEKISQAQQDDPFQVLIATLLSARTQDATTLAASTRLFARARTPRAMAKLTVREIEALIYPVSFYRNKARHVRAACQRLLAVYDGTLGVTARECLRMRPPRRRNRTRRNSSNRPALPNIVNRPAVASPTAPDCAHAALRHQADPSPGQQHHRSDRCRRGDRASRQCRQGAA